MEQKLVCTSDRRWAVESELNVMFFFFHWETEILLKMPCKVRLVGQLRIKKQRTMQEAFDGKIFVAGHSRSSSFQPHTRRRRLRRRLAAAVAVVVVVVVEVSSGWQLNPSPVYPGLQVQLYEPSVFSQFASLWQL